MQLLHALNLPTKHKPWRTVLALPLSSILLCGAPGLAQAAPQIQDKPATTPTLVPDDQNRFLRFLNTSAPQFTDNILPPFALDPATSLANQKPVVEAYYNAIDPDNSKRTLAGFKKANGYDAGVDTLAVYINDADLGFGRRMDVRTNPDKSIASCVANYGGNSTPPSVDDADLDKLSNAEAGGLKGLIATVCMEYSGTPGAYVPAPTTLSLYAYNDDISRTNYNSRISRVLQPGNYRVVAATYASGKTGTFTVKAVGYGLTLLNSSGSWTSSGGQSYTSASNPSFPLTVTQAGTVTINLSSAVDTYLYLLKETSSVPNAQLSGPKFTKFYAYGADVNQSLLLFADLDGRGAKAVPGVCNVCHGGAPNQLDAGVYPKNGDTNAQWLPWDLDNLAYDNRAGSTFTRALQEPKFKILNQSVLATYAQNPTTVSWTGNVAIPDNPTPNPITDIPLTVTNVPGPISQLMLSFDGDATNPGLAHPDISDLNVLLTSPDGTGTYLFWCTSGTNTGSNLYNAFFSDDGGPTIMGRDSGRLGPNPSSGIYRGYSIGLSSFNGKDPNGTWKLGVSDCKTGKTGSVTAWSLHFNGTPDAAYLPAPVELIRGWYGGTSAANPTPNPTFNGQFVPKGWQVPAVVVNGQMLNPSDLYRNVVAPACRACHVQRGNMRRNEIDFGSYDKFTRVYGKKIVELVYDKSLMPLARRTYQNHFWSKNGSTANPPAAVLAQFLGVDMTTRVPGRPIANAGVSRIVANGQKYLLPLPGVPVKLNGGASSFADAFQWQFFSKPVNSTAVLAGATTSAPVFTPDVDGNYDIQLVVARNTGSTVVSSPVSHVTVTRDSINAVPPISFTDNVAESVNNWVSYGFCNSCHYQEPKMPPFSQGVYAARVGDSAIAYKSMSELVDVNDPLSSVLLRKMSGDLPHAGGTSLEATSQGRGFFDSRFDLFLRWILEGAQNN